MESLRKEDMIAEGIRYVMHGKPAVPYFSVDDVKSKYEEIKIHSSDVFMLEIDGEIIPTVKVEDIQPMDDFDKMINKARFFKP